MRKTLKIYFTSDMHGYMAPVDYATGGRKDAGLANMIPHFRKDGNTLLLDGGDTIQGSPFAYLQAQGSSAELFARCMNLAGYDYVTLGNHDFNYGYEYLASYLETLQPSCLCANIADATGRLPILPSAVRVTENGLRVGVIGICTDFINVWEKKANLAKIRVGDVRTALAPVYEKLRPETDVLIGLYHGGFECDVKTGHVLSTTRENIGYEIAREFGFDLLLTGHQHMALAGAEIAGTHVAQTPANAEQYVEAKVVWEDAQDEGRGEGQSERQDERQDERHGERQGERHGRVVSISTQLHPAGGVTDPRAAELLAELEQKFTMVMNNYRASGTGGYEFLRDSPTVREILTDMVELIIRYFEEQVEA